VIAISDNDVGEQHCPYGFQLLYTEPKRNQKHIGL
jgi:hypothetical protein